VFIVKAFLKVKPIRKSGFGCHDWTSGVEEQLFKVAFLKWGGFPCSGICTSYDTLVKSEPGGASERASSVSSKYLEGFGSIRL